MVKRAFTTGPLFLNRGEYMGKALEGLGVVLLFICAVPIILTSVSIGFFSISFMLFFETFLGPILGRIAGLFMGFYFIYLFFGTENKIFIICFLVCFYFFAIFTKIQFFQALVNMEKKKEGTPKELKNTDVK